MNSAVPTIFTIGHSNLGLDQFVRRLHEAGIDTVVDVRSQPVSRFNPHFDRRSLAASLCAEGIRYSFMGDSLGGRPDNAAYYDPDGHVRYDLWSRSEPFRHGITTLIRNAPKYRIALMCSEADPSRCHRQLLLARVLVEQGWPRSRIVHIDGRGVLVPDSEIPNQSDLFGGEATWRSPQSVLHKVQPSISSSV